MAAEKAERKEKKKDKKEKKHKSESDGVAKSEKKEKKSKKSKAVTEALLEKVEEVVQIENGTTARAKDDEDRMEGIETVRIVSADALVPFANPLADEKQTKKLLKSVKKAAKNKTLKRGVKEVVKSLRKSPLTGPASSNASDPIGVVIIAADISPMDVISHIPVLCEDHNIPYIYVTSRAELGSAGSTKRATSVVMVAKNKPVKAGKEAEELEEDYPEAYAELVKLVQKASKGVKV